jgi:hypothetical protein
MKFNFHFGNKKPDIKQYAIIGIALFSTIAALSQCTGVSQNGLWDLLDEIQRKYFPQTVLNDFIIKDPEKLNRRIQRDVDKAIRNVTLEYDRIIQEEDQRYRPRYSEKPIDPTLQTGESRLLGGEMRICAPWVDDCPKN